MLAGLLSGETDLVEGLFVSISFIMVSGSPFLPTAARSLPYTPKHGFLRHPLSHHYYQSQQTPFEVSNALGY